MIESIYLGLNRPEQEASALTTPVRMIVIDRLCDSSGHRLTTEDTHGSVVHKQTIGVHIHKTCAIMTEWCDEQEDRRDQSRSLFGWSQTCRDFKFVRACYARQRPIPESGGRRRGAYQYIVTS